MTTRKHGPAASAALAVTLGAVFTACAPAAFAAEPSGADVVDSLNAVFGNQKARAAHAKGQCVKGTFTPAAGLADITKSASFAKPTAVLGRFSMGGGNPKVPDSTKGAARAFAFRVDPDGKSSDFAFISAPVHFARAPSQMKAFLDARVPGPDGKPDAEKVKAYNAANPNSATQGKWLSERPVPASYGSVSYWGVHAFTLTDGQGTARVAKLKLVPAGGEQGLSDDEAKAKPADFYVPELQERLAKGAVAFKLVALLAEPGDVTNDVTALWPEDSRKAAEIGTIAVTGLEDNARCDAGTFDPTQLADGIAGPKDDPMFAIRSEAYAVSLSRRAN